MSVPETAFPTLQPINGVELSKETSGFLFQALAFEAANGWQVPDPELVNSSFPTKLFHQRTSAINLCPSGALLVLLVILSDGNPGRLVAWTWTLAHMAHKLQKHRITVTDWINEFPLGVPNDAEYNRVWDAQKVQRGGHSVNGFDLAEYWEPLLPIPIAA